MQPSFQTDLSNLANKIRYYLRVTETMVNLGLALSHWRELCEIKGCRRDRLA